MRSEIRSALPDRLTLHRLAKGGDTNSFAGDVRSGLTAERKSLPPKYFYDELGSRLFEAICALPEYYLTRAESEILRDHSAQIVAAIPTPARIPFSSRSCCVVWRR